MLLMYNDGSVQKNRRIFLKRAFYCSSKSSTASTHRPTYMYMYIQLRPSLKCTGHVIKGVVKLRLSGGSTCTCTCRTCTTVGNLMGTGGFVQLCDSYAICLELCNYSILVGIMRNIMLA